MTEAEAREAATVPRGLLDEVARFVNGAGAGGGAALPASRQVEALAESWGVTVALAWRVVGEFAMQRDVLFGEAAEELAGMDWDEVCEELGVR